MKPDKKTALAWILLGIGLLLTALAGLQVRRAIVNEATDRIILTSDQITLQIRERLDAYALILRGAAGLISGRLQVDRREWRLYVERLRSGDGVPGVQGVGFARYIPATELDAHVTGIRSEGFPQYQVWPAGDRDYYSSIIFLEPFSDRNLRAFGYDMLSEPVRREAMERARDADNATLSGKVTLVQETGTENQAGTLMYVPAYRSGMPTTTVAERRAALMGWAYSPYRMTDLMTAILRDWRAEGKTGFDLHVYDGATIGPETLLFDSSGGRNFELSPLAQSRVINFNGRQWQLLFNPHPVAYGIRFAPVFLTIGAGMLISVLLYLLILALIRRREQAAALAEKLVLDIRQREQTLEETENRWRAALEGSGLGVWDWNVPTGTVFFSRLWKEMLGFKENEIGNQLQEWESRVHPDDKAGALEKVSDCLEGRTKTYASEHRLRCKDGRYKWILDRGTVFERSADGKPLRVVGTHSDISARKENEFRLQAMITETQRLRDALDNVAACIYLKNAEGRYVFANKPALELFGCSAEELGRRFDSRYFPPDGIGPRRDSMQRVLRGERITEEITVDDPRRGRRIYLENRTPVYADAQRQTIWGICGIFTDITESRELQEELQESRFELVQAQRIAKVGNWHFDLATDRAIWSEELYRMFGLDPATPAPGFNEQSRIFSPDSWKRVSAGVAKTAATGEPYELELETVRQDNSHGWMLVRGEAVRDAAGTIVGLRGVALDITDRKQAEIQGQRLNRLYAALRECSRAIQDCRTQQELFDRICEIVVEFGGVRLSWIGLVNEDSGTVTPVSTYGFGREYLDNIRITVHADDPYGRGPTGTAIRENHPVWFDNFQQDSRIEPWRQRVAEYGWQAAAALPICRRGKPVGALTFYADEAGLPADEMRELLNRLAAQISVALDRLDLEAQAQLALAALPAAEQSFRFLFDTCSDGMILAEPGGTILAANAAACRLLGHSEEEMRRLGLAGLAQTAQAGTALQTAITSPSFRDQQGNAWIVKVIPAQPGTG
ncbi:CHASE domain-containing protein [Ferrovibrio sp.]|uniref:CHASE domain-containing protein n=1 Tax=Ferrovibrio sp. TaxID=1917215 RepID=UPI0026218B93|nr:CHASE domain-containing protein [Ferrovibrio sp.]